MSQKKKLENAYKIGFSDACQFWEVALGTTKGIGPKTQDKIMENVKKQIREAGTK